MGEEGRSKRDMETKGESMRKREKKELQDRRKRGQTTKTNVRMQIVR